MLQYLPFLAQLNRRLKWGFLIKICSLSIVVFVVVVVVVVNFSHFHLLLQNHRSNFNQTWHFLVKGIQVCSNEGPRLFLRGDNYQIAKKQWRNSIIIFFSWTTRPISTKLGTLHSWVKGIQVPSNEGLRPFLKKDNYQIADIHWRNSNIIFVSWSARTISTKLGT